MDDIYELIDSGNGRKLERFGPYVFDRPCAQAVWKAQRKNKEWRKADGRFLREGKNEWEFSGKLPESWTIEIDGIMFETGPTDFGHLGVFPEHVRSWHKMRDIIDTVPEDKRTEINVLNLFAYSGGASLAAARCGVKVCHLDASKKIVQWARRNADLNDMQDAPIRWIVDDVRKFLLREIRRGNKYDGIILDPPSFGRGAKQEIFKIEDHLGEILDLCRSVLTPSPLFLFLSCHTPGYTPLVMKHLITQTTDGLAGNVTSGEMILTGKNASLPLPSGNFACWERS